MNIRQGVKNIEEKLAFKTLTEAEVRDICLDEYMWIKFKKRIILTHEISETIPPSHLFLRVEYRVIKFLRE